MNDITSTNNTNTNMIKTPHNTILFNIAAFTILKLTKEEANDVYGVIEETMNGDGLYEGYDKEGILEAYNETYNYLNEKTWVELIQEAQGLIKAWEGAIV